MLEKFKDLPIWKEYDKKNTTGYNLDNIASNALALLDKYYVAFPKYTLHNNQHQYNVLRLIGEILGDQIQNLSSLECAIIILTVIYHDIGMIFSEDELAKIEQEESFQIFLDENYSAKLNYRKNDSKLNEELAEWYCRWMHAQRVWRFLDDLGKQRWGTISLRDAIGNICQSHNNSIKILYDDERFQSNFLGQADLKFCAILLRLGDILDFDNSRTPKSVYEYLDLDNPKNESEKISKDEWNKHLCSDGFNITHDDESIQLIFSAGPHHPQIEKNIQTFLDVIEDELKSCIDFISKCSKRWRDFKLPSKIDRSNIKSQNYKKGDFSLSLDEVQIIKLLTGENLYDTGMVFIRELLQNAIDTTRMREYHEESNGNTSFKVKPIEVTTWVDKSGYTWVRVDDFGMGINEYVVTNHLLRKGNSYYSSDYFKIQKRFFREKTKKDFTPISRFGIGLLSCFILGDSIEINSKSVGIQQTKSNEEKIRLSIRGLQGQYYFQSEKDQHIPLEMPNKIKDESEFRIECGTSIAVRIDRNKDYLGFEESLKNMVEYYVTCSPIDIYLNNEKIGVDFNTTLNKPLSIKEFFPFTEEDKNLIEKLIQKEINSDIGIEVLPIDISTTSQTPNFKGQLVFLYLKCRDFEDVHFKTGWDFRFYLFDHRERFIRFTKRQLNEKSGREEEKEIKINLESVFDKAFDNEYFDKLFLSRANPKYYLDRLRLIHNGINVPNYSEKFSYNSSPKLAFYQGLFTNEVIPFRNEVKHGCYGLIYLQDNLIPELSISRNFIKRLQFSIYSNIFFSTKDINNNLLGSQYYYNYLDNIDEHFTLNEIKSDELVISGQWDEEKLIESELGLVCINELKSRLKDKEIKISVRGAYRFLDALTRGLIEINFETEYINDDPKRSFLLIKSLKNKVDVIENEECDYYPLLFLSFNNENILSHNDFINKNHWLGKWIFLNKTYLAFEFEIYFKILIRYIIETNISKINSILEYFRNIEVKNKLQIGKQISEADFHFLKPPF